MSKEDKKESLSITKYLAKETRLSLMCVLRKSQAPERKRQSQSLLTIKPFFFLSLILRQP
jgi:hypothetical protein